MLPSGIRVKPSALPRGHAAFSASTASATTRSGSESRSAAAASSASLSRALLGATLVRISGALAAPKDLELSAEWPTLRKATSASRFDYRTLRNAPDTTVAAMNETLERLPALI